MTYPNFFIVGAPKCGTSSLYDWLNQHPEIFMSPIKEPHYFGSDLCSPRYIRNEEAYRTLFANVTTPRIGEASVWQLYSKRAAQEIHSQVPYAKIIIALRNPVQLMYSLHSQHLFHRDEDTLDFEEALELESERRLGKSLPPHGKTPHGLLYRAVATFSPQIQRYYDNFGRNNVLILLLDDLKENPSDEYRRICQFLEIDGSFNPILKVVNANKVVRSRRILDFLQRPPKLIKDFNHRVPGLLRQFIIDTLIALSKTQQPRPPLDSEVYNRLILEFGPEIKRLETLIDKDLTNWLATK